MKLKNEVNTKPGTGIGYTKVYDELGKLLYYHAGEVYYTYEYDSENRLMKVTSITQSGYGVPDMETEERYEYYDQGYRITRLKTKIIDDSFTTEVLNNQYTLTQEEYSASYPKEVNEIMSVYEVIMENNNMIKSKFTDISNNRFYHTDFTYSDNLLVQEKKYELISGKKTLIYEENREYNEIKKLVKKIENNLLKNEEICLSIQYLDGEVIETYNTNGDIKKVVKQFDLKGDLIQDDDFQYLYVYDFNEDSLDETLILKIEGVVINNYFEVYGTTKYEYY